MQAVWLETLGWPHRSRSAAVDGHVDGVDDAAARDSVSRELEEARERLSIIVDAQFREVAVGRCAGSTDPVYLGCRGGRRRRARLDSFHELFLELLLVEYLPASCERARG